jgi:hypothetical protein
LRWQLPCWCQPASAAGTCPRECPGPGPRDKGPPLSGADSVKPCVSVGISFPSPETSPQVGPRSGTPRVRRALSTPTCRP